MTIEVCFSFNFDVVFDFNLFPVPLSKAKSIGDVLTSRQNAAIRSKVFFLCLLPIDAPNHRALLGDAQRRGEKTCEIIFGNYKCSKIEPHRLMAQGASLRQYTGNNNISKCGNNLLRFAYSWKHCVKNCAFLGEMEIH
jgi:hypothetical protein